MTNADRERAVQTLTLFSEKVQRLDKLSFTKHLREGDVGFSFSVENGQATLQRRGPSEEAIDAFVLTFRFFIQDNERISIRNIGKLYESLPVPVELKKLVTDGRAEINRFLDADSHIVDNAKRLTNREIQDIYLYGGLAHANLDKKKIFDSWARSPMHLMALTTEFIGILTEVLNFLFWLDGVNKEALEHL